MAARHVVFRDAALRVEHADVDIGRAAVPTRVPRAEPILEREREERFEILIGGVRAGHEEERAGRAQRVGAAAVAARVERGVVRDVRAEAGVRLRGRGGRRVRVGDEGGADDVEAGRARAREIFVRADAADVLVAPIRCAHVGVVAVFRIEDEGIVRLAVRAPHAEKKIGAQTLNAAARLRIEHGEGVRKRKAERRVVKNLHAERVVRRGARLPCRCAANGVRQRDALRRRAVP